MLEWIDKSSSYALQVDESTNIDDNAILVYVRYIYQEDVHVDILYLLLLPIITTPAELFKSLNRYLSRKLKLSFCVNICTDESAAMTKRLSGLIAPECKLYHSQGNAGKLKIAAGFLQRIG